MRNLRWLALSLLIAYNSLLGINLLVTGWDHFWDSVAMVIAYAVLSIAATLAAWLRVDDRRTLWWLLLVLNLVYLPFLTATLGM